MQRPNDVFDWRDRAFVTVAESASILARSPDWIRDRVGEGRLDGRRLTQGGPLVVTVASVLRLIERSAPVVPLRPSVRPPLRLVVDNA